MTTTTNIRLCDIHSKELLARKIGSGRPTTPEPGAAGRGLDKAPCNRSTAQQTAGSMSPFLSQLGCGYKIWSGNSGTWRVMGQRGLTPLYIRNIRRDAFWHPGRFRCVGPSIHDQCGTANFVHSRLSNASGHRAPGYGDSTKNILIDGNDPHSESDGDS